MTVDIAHQLSPVHPGEILTEEFLKPLGLSPYRAAAMMRVPRTRVERIAKGAIGVTADTALRLAKLFGTTPIFWMNLQSRYDLLTAEPEAADQVATIEPIVKEAPAA
jgi:addiction module HigA family antidote